MSSDNVWRRWIANDSRIRQRAPRRKAPQPRLLSRLAVQRLEERRMLATFLVLNTNDSGPDSLRQVIVEANATPGADTIAFNIPVTDANFVDIDSGIPGGDAGPDVYVISPLSALPTITDAAIIDGRAQTTFGGDTNPLGPEVVLNGTSAGTAAGLQLNSGNSVVTGVVIQSFGGHGILINGDNHWVHGNYIGTDATGTLARGNAQNGVHAAAALTRIGTNGDGTNDVAERNLISGNGGNGVVISGQIVNLAEADAVSSAASSMSMTAAIAHADLMDSTGGAAGNWTFNYPVPGMGGDDYAIRATGTLFVNVAGTNGTAGHFVRVSRSGERLARLA